MRVHFRNFLIPSSSSGRAGAHVALFAGDVGRPAFGLRRRRDALHPGRRLHDHGAPDHAYQSGRQTRDRVSQQTADDEGLCAK